MLTKHKILAEKYEQVHKEAVNVNSSLKHVYSVLVNIADTAQGKEANSAFNQLLLSLLSSSDQSIVSAATNVLNKQPQVAKEEDEVLDNPHGWPNTSGGGAGF